MKRDRSVRAVALLVAVALAVACGGEREPEEPDPAEVVATIDGTPITRGQLDEVIRTERSRRSGATQGDDLLRGALETLVGTELMYRAALEQGMSVPPERLEEELAGVRSQFANDEEFQAYLAAAGLTEAALAERAARRALVAAYAERVVGDPAPDDAALRAAYEARRESFMEPEAIRASQVLVRAKRKGDSVENNRVAREAAEAAHRRIAAGEPFDVVARELSNGPFAAEGGAMGWFSRGRWMPAFEEIVFDTPVGELTDVFRTPLGYHVVRVEERRPPRPQPYEAVRTSLMLSLTRERRDGALEAHVRTLLDAAALEIHDPELRRAMRADDG